MYYFLVLSSYDEDRTPKDPKAKKKEAKAKKKRDTFRANVCYSTDDCKPDGTTTLLNSVV